MDRHNPHLVFKTLQYQNTWASYDTLEKTIIRSFSEKASVKRKGIDTLNFMDMKRTSILNDIRRGCTPLIAALQRFEEMILRGSFRAPTVVASLIQRLF